MKAVHLLAACFLLFSLFLVGCTRDSGKDHKDHKDDKGKTQAKGDDHKEHKHDKGEKKGDGHEHKPAAHGGKIVSVGTDAYHAEVVFEKDGQLKFYTLAKDETKSIRVESQTLKAHVKHDDKSHEMELKPEPQKDDPKGKSSLFVGKLPAEVIGKNVTVTIVGLKMGDETFRVEFSSEGGKHGDHKEHKDGKEHKDHKKEHGKASKVDEEIREARAKLNEKDRALVDAQEWCPVMADNRLGEMGVPFMVMVKDQPVFVCCKGCQRKALADADTTLKKVDEFKAKVKATPGHKGALEVGDKVPEIALTRLSQAGGPAKPPSAREAKLTKGQVAKIKGGMTLTGVMAILGPRAEINPDPVPFGYVEPEIVVLWREGKERWVGVVFVPEKNGVLRVLDVEKVGGTNIGVGGLKE